MDAKFVGKSIPERLHEMMIRIPYIQKDKKIESKDGRSSYRVILESDVLERVRPLMLEVGLVLIQTGCIAQKHDTVTTVEVKYRLIAVDTGDYLDVASCGQGEDRFDKGFGKALTTAEKYFWLKSLYIETGDDPDQIGTDEIIDRNEKIINDLAEKLRISAKQALETDRLNKEKYDFFINKISIAQEKSSIQLLRDGETFLASILKSPI
jgi:hypothetical protein